MCEKYKISIGNENKNLEIEGPDKEWVEGNSRQFLDRIISRHIVQMIESTLKKRIGVFLFIVSVATFFICRKFVVVADIQRFLYSCAFGLFGLFCRTFIYYGFLRKDLSRELNKKEIWDCLFAYILYYPLGLLAVISIIFVISYKNLVEMNIGLFYPVALFLFSALGFAVFESLNMFLLKINNK